MKKITLYALSTALVATLASCEKKAEPETAMQLPPASEEQLEQAVQDRDELISLVTEINDGMSQIKQLENIVTYDNSETPNRRQQLIADIQAIKTSIAERQKRLAELEQKLKSSSRYSESLKADIAKLHATIEEQTASIANLTAQLNEANATIATQSGQIDSLNTTVQNVSGQLASSQDENVQLTNKLNTCYYVVGNTSELKEHKILEKKFLGRTKIMAGDFEKSYFTTADKRTLTSIPLYSKKAEVMSNQPTGSYTIETAANGSKTLKITNPEKFWEKTNYLVIKID